MQPTREPTGEPTGPIVTGSRTKAVVVASLVAVVPTFVVLVAALAVNGAVCDADSVDCSWGLALLPVIVVAPIACLVASPLALWWGLRRQDPTFAAVAAAFSAGFMLFDLVIVAVILAAAWPVWSAIPLAVLFGLTSPMAAVATAGSTRPS